MAGSGAPEGGRCWPSSERAAELARRGLAVTSRRVDQAQPAAVADQRSVARPERDEAGAVELRSRGWPTVTAEARLARRGDRIYVAGQHGHAVESAGAADDDLKPRLVMVRVADDHVAQRLAAMAREGSVSAEPGPVDGAVVRSPVAPAPLLAVTRTAKARPPPPRCHRVRGWGFPRFESPLSRVTSGQIEPVLVPVAALNREAVVERRSRVQLAGVPPVLMTRSGWSRRAATVTASKSSSAAFRAQRQDRRSCPVVRGRAGTVILGPHAEVPDRGAALAAASSAPGQAAGLGESVAMRACRALYPCPRWGLAGRWLTHAGSAALARGGRSRRRSQGGTPADEPLSACANQRPGIWP
jgi:hypothetical protein